MISYALEMLHMNRLGNRGGGLGVYWGDWTDKPAWVRALSLSLATLGVFLDDSCNEGSVPLSIYHLLEHRQFENV